MNQKFKVIVTGGGGFVGSRLVKKLDDHVILFGRTSPHDYKGKFYNIDITPSFDYHGYMNEVQAVIHCAARVHIMDDNAEDPLSDFREINTYGTLNLAQQAADAGVKRFIFVSSIKVNGESTTLNKPYHYNDTALPEDAYGQSKAEAEVGLRNIAKETGMEVVIIRPPLVYGPGVKANFAAIMKLAAKNLPLPLGAIYNKRSLVALDNLVDLIVTCIDHPKAANETFLVSDGQDVSITELLNKMTVAAGKKPWLIPVPMKLIQLGAIMLGKKAVADRLCGSLQVDISHTKDKLNWKPVITLEQGLARCFQERKK
jgi:nucleoside-diphosphate-sugar epimerase